MFFVQPVVWLMHLINSISNVILGFTYHFGGGIIFLLTKICKSLNMLEKAVVLVCDEFYTFVRELVSSISAFENFVNGRANCGINAIVESLWSFFDCLFAISENSNTRCIRIDLWRGILNSISVFLRAIVLIGDFILWLPETFLLHAICVGDKLVFAIHTAGRTLLLLLDSILRCMVIIVIFSVLFWKRRRFKLYCIWCLVTLKNFVHNQAIKLGTSWSRLLPQRSPDQISVTGDVLHRRNDIVESIYCVVCRDSPKNVLLLPCKHLCLCKECADYMASTHNQHCPLCRSHILNYMLVFL